MGCLLVQQGERLFGTSSAPVYLYIANGLFIYVDDGLVLLPADIAPLVGCASLMFLVALGVPMS